MDGKTLIAEPNQAASTKKRDTIIGAVALVAAVFAISVWLQPSEEQQAANKTAGFHCLSNLDGSHSQLVASVKAVLNDPASFEHVETKVTPVHPNGRHDLLMQFRAKNGFGALMLQQARASFSNADCSIVTWNMIG